MHPNIVSAAVGMPDRLLRPCHVWQP